MIIYVNFGHYPDPQKQKALDQIQEKWTRFNEEFYQLYMRNPYSIARKERLHKDQRQNLKVISE